MSIIKILITLKKLILTLITLTIISTLIILIVTLSKTLLMSLKALQIVKHTYSLVFMDRKGFFRRIREFYFKFINKLKIYWQSRLLIRPDNYSILQTTFNGYLLSIDIENYWE
jgi:hypothetical protein